MREGDLRESTAEKSPSPSWRKTVSACVALTKPGLTAMSAGTAVAGGLLAARGWQDAGTLAALAVGTFLVGAGAIALNQYVERAFDGLMRRTIRRPLQTGALTPPQALWFGLALEAIGLLVLAIFTNPLATGLAALTVATYLLVYTPLKRKTHLATAVGGFPGAIPPVIGWVSITGSVSIEAYILFLVLYLWQIPHSLALGWLYRVDYQRAGYRLLPSLDPTGKATGRVIFLFSLALIPASVLPYIAGMAGVPFLVGILMAGIGFAVPAARFAHTVSDRKARAVFVASLIYVPLFYGLMWADQMSLYL